MFSESGEHYKHYGKWYRVARQSKDEKVINDWLLENENYGVLATAEDGTHIVAHLKDMGRAEKSINLKYYRSDSGFCRVYFKTPDKKKLYCIQKAGHYSNRWFELMPCTSDGEPEYSLPLELIGSIDKPKGDDSIDSEIIEVLTKKGILPLEG